MPVSAPFRAIFLVFVVVVLGLQGPCRASAQEEVWEAVYINSTHSGFRHLSIRDLQVKGEPRKEVRAELVLTLKRGDKVIKMRYFHGTLETPQGDPLKFVNEVTTPGSKVLARGSVNENGLRVVVERNGQKQANDYPWEAGIAGPEGLERELMRVPMVPGEERSLKLLHPAVNQGCTIRLLAKDRETVEIPGQGERKLLRVETEATGLQGLALPDAKATYWVDDPGRIQKTECELAFPMTLYRVSKEEATADVGEGVNLLGLATIPVDRQIANPRLVRNAVLEIRLKENDPIELFPPDRRQDVRRGESEGTIIVKIHTQEPGEGQPGPKEPAEEYIKPNRLVESESPRVQVLMREAVGKLTDPWEKACAIPGWVNAHMEHKLGEVGLQPAGKLAQSLAGDPYAYVVLTAALARAAGIPSRCAIGLIYSEQWGGFLPHAWNEVYIEGRWVAVDSIFAQTEVDALHIKMDDTSLAAGDELRAFQSLNRVLQRASVRVLKTDPAPEADDPHPRK